MRIFSRLFLAFLFLSTLSVAQTKEEQDAAYAKTITQRAEKIVASLVIPDQQAAAKVSDIIVLQYRSLNDIHTTKDEKIKQAKAQKEANKSLAEEQMKNAENEANARLYTLHFDFIAKLMMFLTPDQIEKVKDGLTYGVVPITYKGYCDMVLGLTDEQKLQIKVWLIEAREHAMDAGTSDEKHKCFGKYKGRINNYLSAAGYDMKKEGEDWQKRIKDAQKKAE